MWISSPPPPPGDVNGPLVNSLTSTETPLPSARTVSTTVHTPLNKTDPSFTVMLMQWGQFLDHDISGTPVGQSLSQSVSLSVCVLGDA